MFMFLHQPTTQTFQFIHIMILTYCLPIQGYFQVEEICVDVPLLDYGFEGLDYFVEFLG